MVFMYEKEDPSEGQAEAEELRTHDQRLFRDPWEGLQYIKVEKSSSQVTGREEKGWYPPDTLHDWGWRDRGNVFSF